MYFKCQFDKKARYVFDAVSSKSKQALFSACSCFSAGDGQIIYLQDDETSHLYFVISGYVRLSYFMEDGSATLCDVITANECCGELGVLDGGSYGDMAMSIGESVLYSISVSVFRDLCSNYADLGEALAMAVALRYRSYVEFARILSIKMLHARVARVILRLVDSLGAVVSHNGKAVPCTIPAITQTDLGLMARGSRGGVNRVLKMLVHKGVISIKDRVILVMDRDGLEDCAYAGCF